MLDDKTNIMLAKLFLEYEKEYGHKPSDGKQRAYANSITRKTIGGENYFYSRRDRLARLKERKEGRISKGSRKAFDAWIEREKVRKNYREIWAKFTPKQKQQFRDWFNEKIKLQVINDKKMWTVYQGLSHVLRRIERLSEKYFVFGKNLTMAQWAFVGDFSEFFGDMKAVLKTSAYVEDVKHSKNQKLMWYKPRKPSSWILRFRYEGIRSKKRKGILRVIMKRGKLAYPFYNFPYVLFVLMKNLRTSLGKYWWEQWLWRYSTNPNKYRKFAYSKRQDTLERYLRSR